MTRGRVDSGSELVPGRVDPLPNKVPGWVSAKKSDTGMASPQSSSKRLKTDDFDYVEGFIYEVGPLIESKKTGNKYFNAQLQEKMQVTTIVGFRQKHKDELKMLEKSEVIQAKETVNIINIYTPSRDGSEKV